MEHACARLFDRSALAKWGNVCTVQDGILSRHRFACIAEDVNHPFVGTGKNGGKGTGECILRGVFCGGAFTTFTTHAFTLFFHQWDDDVRWASTTI